LHLRDCLPVADALGFPTRVFGSSPSLCRPVAGFFLRSAGFLSRQAASLGSILAGDGSFPSGLAALSGISFGEAAGLFPGVGGILTSHARCIHRLCTPPARFLAGLVAVKVAAEAL